nr:AAA family ATPase [Actinomycetota bacterium]
EAGKAARHNVAFYDITFNVQKSVTLVHTAFEAKEVEARRAGDEETAQAWAQCRKAVEDAIWAGNNAGLAYLAENAGYSRVGHHGGGAGRWMDAHHWVVAQFLQHDSRDRDPQLHVHNAILNRVRCADGTWRALDSRAIHDWRGAAAAIAERVMEAHLTRALGVRFETRPDGRAREVIGVRQDLMDLFSSRRRTITAKAEQLVSAFTARFGREPSALERTGLSQQATLATRKAKSHDGETLGDRLDRWEAETRAKVAGGLAEVARHVLDLAQRVAPAATWSERDVTERALALAAQNGQSWSRSDLLRAVSDELPGHIDVAPEQVPDLLEELTDAAAALAVRHTPEPDTTDSPAEFVLANGKSVFTRPGSERYSTRGQFAAEQTLRAAAVRRGAATFTAAEADRVIARYAESGRELGADQAAVVRGVLTSGAAMEGVSAAAGTGKTFTVGAIADAWQNTGRRVFGLAPSQTAAMVLAEEGVQAANTAAWLGTRRRLDDDRPGSPDPRGDREWRLRDGDLVVVDEAGMTATGDIAEVQRRCEAAGAKLLLVGDPRQLAAVGPGGAFADLAEHGVTYQLAEVRRFTAAWEGPASLRLRDGDTAAVGEYTKHGRLVDGGTAEQAEARAERRWLADTLARRDSVLLVGSNEAAARASAALRAELVALGRVTQAGVPLGREGWQGTVAGVGDLVQARRNGWELVGIEGNTRAPINRETYRVTGVRDDGGLTVAPVHGRVDGAEQLGEPITLPASYVAADLTLGYASTVHAAQG